MLPLWMLLLRGIRNDGDWEGGAGVIIIFDLMFDLNNKLIYITLCPPRSKKKNRPPLQSFGLFCLLSSIAHSPRELSKNQLPSKRFFKGLKSLNFWRRKALKLIKTRESSLDKASSFFAKTYIVLVSNIWHKVGNLLTPRKIKKVVLSWFRGH